jgi:S-adenosylmethionine synthetase
MTRLFTSESVTSGHPDKMCDQISDAILDAILAQDPGARVAVETAVTTGQVHVMGEVTTSAYVEIPQIVREVVTGIGYTSSAYGFDGRTAGVNVAIGQQSPDIAGGVNTALELRDWRRGGEPAVDVDQYGAQGAGDQGLMFGYADTTTPELYPLAPYLAHRLAERLEDVRHRLGVTGPLRPDGKTQVTVSVDPYGVIDAIDTIVVSTQHSEGTSIRELTELVTAQVIDPVLAEHVPDNIRTGGVRVIVNPAGPFIVGGPMGDAGLTGRKIIVDTYGGVGRHGGGAFSGKDPSKVDRSAAYAMRWVAKNIVAADLASRAEVQVAYAIGKAEPVGLYVDTFGTGIHSDDRIASAVSHAFDLRPAAIIDRLDLLRPIYQQTAAYGHFGRELDDFTWERTDMAETLRAFI